MEPPILSPISPSRAGIGHAARHGQVPGAATAWVRDQLAGPGRTARVLHVGRDATYVDLDGSCLGVLSRAATHVPCGIRTTLAALVGLPGLGRAMVGDPVTVGDGRVSFAGTDVVVARLVDASAPALDASSAEVRTRARRHSEALPWQTVTAEIPDTALAALRAGDPGVVTDLLGRGGGLTPLGDDVLCGWLATAGALGRDDRAAVATQVGRLAAARTTTLSATLLDCAVRGDVLPQFRRLLLALAAPARSANPQPALADSTLADSTLADLLKVGHTSGTGLAAGALLALHLSAHEGNDR